MQVVRLELEDGSGPWRSMLSQGWLHDILEKTTDRHSTANPKGMPLPEKDGIKDFDKYGLDKCAYLSLRDMKRWVDMDELSEAIKNYGLKVFSIKLKQWKLGKNQAAYREEWVERRRDISKQFIKNKTKKDGNNS